MVIFTFILNASLDKNAYLSGRQHIASSCATSKQISVVRSSDNLPDVRSADDYKEGIGIDFGLQKQNNSRMPMSVEQWESKFLSIWNSEDTSYYDQWSKSSNSSWYYFLAHGIDGDTSMFEATGKTEYLDRALYYINNVVSDARLSSAIPTSQYKDSYLGWVASSPNEPEINGKEVPLYESYMWRYVTKLLRVIRQNPQLYDNPTYRHQYDSLLHFTEVNVFEKWYNRNPSNIYRSRTHIASHWAYIALDLCLISEDVGKMASYSEVLTKINTDLSPYYSSSLRAQIISNPKDDSAYFWDSIWGSYARPGQDTSHGNNVISYMIEAHDQGVYWNDADINGLKNLLVKVLWNGSYASPSFSGYFDGGDPGGGDFQSDGFIKLGRYDLKIQCIYENYSGQNSYLTQLYGNGALNAKILLSGAGVASPTPLLQASVPPSTTALDAGATCPRMMFLPLILR